MKNFTLILMAAATLCTPSFAQNRVRNIYTSANKLNVDLLKSTDETVQVNRTLMGGYNTICLPMTLTGEQLANAAKDVQVERLAAIRQEGSTLYMYFLDCTQEGIKAGEPYLIFSPITQMLRAKNTENKGISTELKSVTMSDSEGNTVTFGSSWEALQVAGRYGIPAQQDTYLLESVLIRTEADKTFLPTRCGFTWDEQSGSATNLEIKHVTSLSAIGTTALQRVADQDGVVDVYDTKGTLVKKGVRINEAKKSLPRGIYVVGGEKIAVQ
jgi:hypothetical protein